MKNSALVATLRRKQMEIEGDVSFGWTDTDARILFLDGSI